MLKEFVTRNRSYRRFYQNHKIDLETLRELIDLARLSATGGNKQPLKFLLSCDAERNNSIFQLLTFAGYLQPWSPKEGEKPSAYIVILGDTRISQSFGVDHGIAAQSIMLGAAEKGLGGCIMSGVRKDELRMAFKIPPYLEILLVLALGKPLEKVVIDPMRPDGNVKYWRDGEGIHHVPKRALDDIILA